MEKRDSKKVFQLALNEINNSEDPTKVDCSFIILDFEKSLNNTVISKEDALNGLSKSIDNKPIVGNYNSTDSENPDDDNFKGHEAFIDENKHGELYVGLDTTPMGVFTSEGYIETIEVDGESREVLMADAILWKDRFPEAIELLQEWNSRGVNINTSCELLYSNYEVKDGVEHIKSPIHFSGHCILASEERGDLPLVNPAYETSKLVGFNELKQFKKLVAQAMNKKEDEQMPEMFKKVFELSHSDIRTALYQVFDAQLGDNQYSYIRDVYDNNFIVDIDTVTETDYQSETFKYDFSKSEDDKITINFDSKTAVMKKTEWIELEETKQLQAQISEKDSAIQSLNNEKKDLQEKFNSASETITSLNSTVEDLNSYKEKYEQAQFEEKLEEKKELYSAKFSALNATEKFESEEVQTLIEKSVTDDEAQFSLNSILVDLVEVKNEQKKDNQEFVQLNNKRQNLVPVDEDFDSRYK